VFVEQPLDTQATLAILHGHIMSDEAASVTGGGRATGATGESG
jgi:hypothetical protein